MTELSFGDGFRFGCGFIAAGVVFYIILAIISVIVVLLLGVLGGGVLNNLPGFLPKSSSLLLMAPGLLV
jgi:hypothetical protein